MSRTHGHAKGSGSPTYKTWCKMKERCLNKNHVRYHRYGGRGITICKRWLNSFECFLKDMGVRPKNKTLDRIDNDGHYTKKNCKWSTAKQQARNTRLCKK